VGFDRIKGQDAAVAMLKSAFESGRFSHAYLFHGPDGVGKETTALELAKALNCEASVFNGCGKCRQCVMASAFGHPDIHLLFPSPRDAKVADRAEWIAGYARDGYREQSFGRKAAIISVEAVLSEVVANANKRPYVGTWKVFVIADADRMTTEASNTLLKTLEEPPEQTVIVLTSSRSSALPPTVVSRCQRIQFSRLPREAVEEVLVSDARLGFDKEGARAAAASAQGSPGLAVRGERGGVSAELESVAAIMAGRRAHDVPSLLDEAGRLAYRLGRREQQDTLDLMLLWLRDVAALLRAREGAAEPDLLFARHRADLEAQAGAMSFADVERLVWKIDDARRAVERYSNASVVFTSVLLDVAIARKQAVRGTGNAA
jgi:DNA polymerase-3 subunit delta'